MRRARKHEKICFFIDSIFYCPKRLTDYDFANNIHGDRHFTTTISITSYAPYHSIFLSIFMRLKTIIRQEFFFQISFFISRIIHQQKRILFDVSWYEKKRTHNQLLWLGSNSGGGRPTVNGYWTTDYWSQLEVKKYERIFFTLFSDLSLSLSLGLGLSPSLSWTLSRSLSRTLSLSLSLSLGLGLSLPS